jgi:hypothetical protein
MTRVRRDTKVGAAIALEKAWADPAAHGEA